MSRFDEIQQQIAEAKVVLQEQKEHSKSARLVWEQSLQVECDIEKQIRDLREQLVDEKQRVFDEDGTFIREWI